MKIIVGIGNPGKEYEGTRHNVGFMALDLFAKRHGFGAWRRRFQSRAAEGNVAGEKVLLLKPQTYVNESGRALRAAMNWCHAEPPDVMVVCDDFNLPLGKLRVRAGGSSGGHKGLESVFAHLGGNRTPRVRVGIGIEGASRDKDFVLAGFSADERRVVDAACASVVEGLEIWLADGLARCQNELNRSQDPTTTDKQE